MQSLNSLKDKISAKISEQDRVVLGLSGGPDSVFLFHLLKRNLRQNQLIACHVNYGLRGKDSDADQAFTEKLCKKHNIQLEIRKAPSSINTGNLENNCRNLRYKFFEKIRSENNAKYIIVAHHLNDQIETFFQNFARGSSLKGFQGMREYDKDRKLWRPLLNFKKSIIIKWLKINNIKYRTDKSNFSNIFTRNIIRHEVIPIFERLNPNFIQTAEQSLEDLQKNLQIVEKITQEWITKHLKIQNKQNYFELETFLHESPIMQKNIIRTLYKNTYKKSLTNNTISEILNTLNKNRAGLQKEFGKTAKLKTMKENKKNKRIVVIEHKLD